jgi:protein TonB
VQGGVPGGVEGGVPGGVAGGVPGGVADGIADSSREAGAEAKKAPERKLVHKVDPAYPAEAKKKAIEGLVLIDVLITAAGDVKDVKVTKGPSELHESAVSAVSQWKYEAGPHDTRATLTIHYRLSKKDEKPRP